MSGQLPEGLWTPRQLPTPSHELQFLSGKPNISEAVGVTMDYLTYLGGVHDANREGVEEQTTEHYEKLTNLGYDGRLYRLPSGLNVPSGALLAAAEGLRPGDVAKRFRYGPLWVPGTEAESFTAEQLDGNRLVIVSRLAIYTAAETGVDPLLHHTALPYDDYAKKWWDHKAWATQLEMIEADRATFAKQHGHEGFNLEQSDQRDYLVLAGMDRIRGLNLNAANFVDPRSEQFVLNRGAMRLSDRRSVDCDSVVGNVNSNGGGLRLNRTNGDANSNAGVGLSAEQAEA